MKELSNLIAKKHKISGIDINLPITNSEIIEFERETGFKLPIEFKEFYLNCNGFSCEEDIFNMISLTEIRRELSDFGDNWFYFAEYMHYSDMWGLRVLNSGEYEIFNGSYPEKAMTSSLTEFLQRFLDGDVFESGGLYDWHKELKINCS